MSQKNKKITTGILVYVVIVFSLIACDFILSQGVIHFNYAPYLIRGLVYTLVICLILFFLKKFKER